MSDRSKPPGEPPPVASEPGELIQAIYDSALDPLGLNGTLDRIRRYIKACAVYLLGHEAAASHSMTLYNARLPADPGHPDQIYWYARDRWTQGTAWCDPNQGAGLAANPLLDGHPCGYREFFDDWLAGRDIKDVLAVNLGRGGAAGGGQPDSTRAILCAFRGQPAEYFNEQDLGKLQGLAPHLNRAYRMALRLGRLERDSALRESVINHFSHPVFLLSDQRSILEANPAGRQLLESPPAAIRLQQGKLQALGLRANPAIDEAFRQASQGLGVRIVFLFAREQGAVETGCACLRALTTSSPWDRTIQQACYLLMLKLASPVNEDGFIAFCGLFGLSKAEQGVLRAMVEEPDTAAIAASLGLHLATVRTHLGIIREKAGVRRISELLRMAYNATRPI